jgi:hypothetical protein
MISILLAFLFSFQAHAQQLPVEVVDQGACWARQMDEETWNIASFNDQKSFILNQTRLQYELEPAITAKLKELGLTSLAKTKYDVHLHCSGAGHIVIANFKDADTPVCLYTNHELTEIKVYANPFREEGACHGVGLEQVIIKALDLNHAKILADLFLTPKYQGLVKSSELLETLNALTVELQPSWRFKEAQAMEAINADGELKQHIESVMLSEVWTIVGQAIPLLSREYRGFETQASGPSVK